MGHQNPYIDERETMQWTYVQKDKWTVIWIALHRKTKDWATQTAWKTGVN